MSNVLPPPIPPYITSITQHNGSRRYKCTVCLTCTMANFQAHVASQSHHTAVQAFVAQQQADQHQLQQFQSRPRSSTQSVEEEHNFFDHIEELSDPPSPPPSPLTILRTLDNPTPFGVGNDDDSDYSNAALDFESLRQAFETLGNDSEEHDENLDEELLEEDVRGVEIKDSEAWYLFKTKEHVMALLMISSARNLLSRTQYQRIRSILRIGAVNLPEWGSLRALVKRLKKKFGLQLQERISPCGNPLFGSDVKIIISNELANPLVCPHLVFVPELTLEGPTNRLSQCKKWCEEYLPEMRVQMIVWKNTHYYIYKPVQLQTQQLVVSLFFFQQDNCLMARCLPALVIPDADVQNSLKVIIPDIHDFNSDELFTIKCKDFWRTFPNIEVQDGVFLKDMCGDHMYYSHDLSRPSHPIENKWRAKADRKFIRHIPTSLYLDNTSGNVSKKWNKHMRIYFTLAGLPPSVANQEFNIHFLATSNCASALELFDQVVDDLNEHDKKGFIAYNHSIGKDIWMMPVVLFHLGDSPMHAEITNTLNPANTLTPCRMCDLRAPKKAEKESDVFVRAFLGLDAYGRKCLLPGRDWNLTRERTREIWSISQKRNTKTWVEALARQYGTRDTLNEFFQTKVQAADESIPPAEVEEICMQLETNFGNRVFNPMLGLEGFDGHADTPVEILHVVLLGIAKYLFRDSMKELGSVKIGSKTYNNLSARWRSVNTKGWNIPPIQPNVFVTFYQSLVGREFRTVLQLVPFVLFEHLSQEKRDMWTSLCILSSYIFQTKMSNMKTYLDKLDIMISQFLDHLISLNARWVNKPKFHMLVHLQESIQRFGPASLFATEKFESFNGVMQHTSVHSNHHSPGQDIANSFNTQLMMRIFISGASFFDHDLQTRVFGGHQLQGLLSSVLELFQAMGLDKDMDSLNSYFIGRLCERQSDKPECLTQS
ncbi:hypothetical protein DFH28DRAFT_1064014 [Melampsora americana]|nr:hypothetical protein DFH28DRAFT_1064014 [Melampsora americana]